MQTLQQFITESLNQPAPFDIKSGTKIILKGLPVEMVSMDRFSDGSIHFWVVDPINNIAVELHYDSIISAIDAGWDLT